MPEVKPKYAHDDFLFNEPPGEDDDPCTPVLTLDQIEAWLETRICRRKREADGLAQEGQYSQSNATTHGWYELERLLAQVQAWKEGTCQK